MESLSPLKRSIISASSSNSDLTNQKIANEIGCSDSYVSKVRQEYSDTIKNREYFPEIRPVTSFSRPYSVLLSEEARDNLDVEVGDVVKLSFLIENNEITYYAGVNDIDELDVNKEVGHTLYALYNLPKEHHENIPPNISDYIHGDSSKPNIYTEQGLESLLENLNRKIEFEKTTSHCVLGAGICEQITNIESEDIIRTPIVPYYAENFANYFSNGGEVLFEISKYDGEIQNPDTVYFMSKSELKDEEKEELISYISSIQYFNRRPYSLSTTKRIRGPASGTVDSPVIGVTEDSVEIVSESAKTIATQNNNGNISYDEIYDIVDNLVLVSEDESEKIPIEIEEFPDYSMIRLAFSGLFVSIIVENDTVNFIYFSEIGSLDDIVTDVINRVSDHLDADNEITGPYGVSRISELDANKWVLDTNSIYHQVAGSGPSSIVNTLLPNIELYNSDIIIPWVVIHEINRHKNTESAGASVRDQGVENINILTILSEYDLIDLTVEDVPNEPLSELQSSAIADMHVLSSAQEHNSGLFTSDRELSRLAEASGVETANIREHAFIEPDVEPHQLTWEDTKEKFKDGDIKHEELVRTIIDQLRQEAVRSVDISKSTQSDPRKIAEDHIHEWLEKELIIPLQENKVTKYALTRELGVIPTYDLISHIYDHVNEDGYLDDVFLEKIRKKYGLHEYRKPLLNFYIPESYVLRAQSECTSAKIEGTLESLLNIRLIENAKYTPISVDTSQDSTLVEDAIEIAREEDSLLLCRDGDSNLDKLSGLLDIQIKKLVSA